MSEHVESAKVEDLQVDLLDIARGNEMEGLVPIDGWEDSTHEVTILWKRTHEGGNSFFLLLKPKTGTRPAGVGLPFDVVQQVRHERHSYPFVEPILGHEATALALGDPRAAQGLTQQA